MFRLYRSIPTDAIPFLFRMLIIKEDAKYVHLQDPHELASWVKEIVELNPATPNFPLPHSPIPPPPAAESGSGGAKAVQRYGDRLACQSTSPTRQARGGRTRTKTDPCQHAISRTL